MSRNTHIGATRPQTAFGAFGVGMGQPLARTTGQDTSLARPRLGFTLVELLVVITIIGILASLAMVGIMAAMNAARRTAIKLEIDNIAGEFQEYKTAHGGAYPPNCVMSGDPQTRAPADLNRHLKKAFPRHQEPPELMAKLVGIVDGALQGGMNPAEAVVFWLGGFSDDARYPISGKGGPSYGPNDPEVLEDRNFLYNFDIQRLGPRGPDGFFDDSSGRGRYIEYTVGGNQRRINFWTYHPRGKQKPFLYFDTSRYKPFRSDGGSPVANYDPTWQGISPIKRLSKASKSNVNLRLLVQFANPDSFQILHAGVDDEWGLTQQLSIGAGDELILYPDGPFKEDLSDNLVNFSDSTLEDSEP